MIANQAWWSELLPLIKLEIYDRDGGHSHPRHRIEVNVPPGREQYWLNVTMPCVACGAEINPVRGRQARNAGKRGQPRHFFLAVSCLLDVSIGCSRGKAARDEYTRIKQAVEGYRAGHV